MEVMCLKLMVTKFASLQTERARGWSITEESKEKYKIW